ncbi:hypothetical protein [Candidatus Accumulibacter sp. ACC003]|uniref:hypothetical protein n=1 Tax=Candidatus Accumulibacter sp. ACC003 TaxID=2823334 RepID=UPI0025B8D8FB|nr:hypothetical protein [Candidatus Accumulibacter sp. ACC003]
MREGIDPGHRATYLPRWRPDISNTIEATPTRAQGNAEKVNFKNEITAAQTCVKRVDRLLKRRINVITLGVRDPAALEAGDFSAAGERYSSYEIT